MRWGKGSERRPEAAHGRRKARIGDTRHTRVDIAAQECFGQFPTPRFALAHGRRPSRVAVRLSPPRTTDARIWDKALRRLFHLLGWFFRPGIFSRGLTSATVASTSRVSEVVIVWRTMGCSLPIFTLPMVTVLRRGRAKKRGREKRVGCLVRQRTGGGVVVGLMTGCHKKTKAFWEFRPFFSAMRDVIGPVVGAKDVALGSIARLSTRRRPLFPTLTWWDGGWSCSCTRSTPPGAGAGRGRPRQPRSQSCSRWRPRESPWRRRRAWRRSGACSRAPERRRGAGIRGQSREPP